MLLATDLAALDHHEGTVTLIANAINWDASDERVDEAYDDAVARLDAMTAELAAPAPATVAVYRPAEPAVHPAPAPRRSTTRPSRRRRSEIRAGEAFQVVVSQRFETGAPRDPLDVYRVLRATNPSPYMYLLRLQSAAGDRFDIVGSSPEALVDRRRRQATTHPIAGTRWRGATAEEDELLEKDLLRRREGARRARHAGRPRPQRPRPGLRAGQRQGAQLLLRRALQPRHAPRVDRHRDAARGPQRRRRRRRPASRPARCPGRRSRARWRSSRSWSRPAAGSTAGSSATSTSPATPTPRSPSGPHCSATGSPTCRRAPGSSPTRTRRPRTRRR